MEGFGMTDTEQKNAENLTFARLALALANDYQSVYYLNTEDDSYVEYGASGSDKELIVLSHGSDFFEDTIYNCRRMVYPDDQERFLDTFRKNNLMRAVRNNSSFTLNYRLVINGTPCYYNLKTIKGTGSDDKYIVIGVRNVDEEVKREQAAAAESETYSHIAKALASRYEVIYYIDILTDSYIEYSSSEQYAKLGVNKQGSDFFSAVKTELKEIIYPEDCARVLSQLDREKFLNDIDIAGSLNLTYRQLLDGRPQYVSLTAVKPKNDPDHVVMGVLNIDAAKRREMAFREALGNAIDLANRDGLTSVRNKHAYTNYENEMNEKIAENINPDFAVAIFDINGLKDINDELGHIAGDEYIKSACEMICGIFKHSPVFRIGGDEFAVLLTGSDYNERYTLMNDIENSVRNNHEHHLVTIAGGMSEFNPAHDTVVQDAFARADSIMYENKKHFKMLRSESTV